MGIFRSIWEIRPLIGENRHYYNKVKGILEGEYLKAIKKGLNSNKIGFETVKLGISDNIGNDAGVGLLHVKVPDKEAEIFAAEMNTLIEEAAYKKLVPEFAKKAEAAIPKYIAHKFSGLDNVKKAIAVLLFAKGYPLNILLIGDPKTGKKTILKSAEALYSKTSSGSADNGLVMTKEMTPGLLPMANGGICIINDMAIKKDDYKEIYSAMENGFVSYMKSGKPERLEAKTRILACADPIGGKFRGDDIDSFIRQLPFERSLLPRFQIIFLIKKPDKEQFVNISEMVEAEKVKIPDEDIRFIREYIKQAEKIDVIFPKDMKESAARLADDIKAKEDELFFGASDKNVEAVGFFAKAFARMNLRNTVNEEDVKKARELIMNSLINKLN